FSRSRKKTPENTPLPHLKGRHSAVEGGRFLRFVSAQSAMGEEEEIFLMPFLPTQRPEYVLREPYWPADCAAVMVGVAARLTLLGEQGVDQRLVAGCASLLDSSPITGIGRALSPVPTLLPMHITESAVIIAGPSLGNHADGRAAGVAAARIEVRDVNLELFDRVGVGHKANAPSARRVGHAVEREFVAAHAARRADARCADVRMQAQVVGLRRPLKTRDAARLENSVVAEDGQAANLFLAERGRAVGRCRF